MIWLWVLMALMTAGVLAALLRPMLRVGSGSVDRAGYDLAVYRDQLDELGRDEARGVISPAEAAAARLEIERRLLAVTPRPEPPARPARLTATIVMLLVPIAALGLYLTLGDPDMPDQPLAGRGAERPLLADDGSLDPAKVKPALEARLKADPGSLEGWLLLGRTDAALGDWDGGKAAYAQAMTLSHDRPDVMEAYGELLVGSAEGQVTPPATDLFTRAVTADRNRIKARYYLALAAAQQGRLAEAIADWKALEADAPATAPWLATVVELRQEAERRLAGDAEPAPPMPAPADPGAAAIAKLPPGEQGQAIRGMVEGLAARLDAHPDDLAGWQRLARAYVVLGEGQKAQAAYRQVLQRDPKQPDALWQVGLADAANGDKTAAAAHWHTLLTELPAGSPAAATVQKALDGLASN
jgi:cytochrome c-type biogenesis protein CcmH